MHDMVAAAAGRIPVRLLDGIRARPSAGDGVATAEAAATGRKVHRCC